MRHSLPRRLLSTPRSPPSTWLHPRFCRADAQAVSGRIFRRTDTTALLAEKRQALLAVAAGHGAHSVQVFGSVARGEDSPGNDIDLLVDLDRDRNLLDLAELVADLRDVLGREVDVAVEQNLFRLLRPRILSEARPL